MIPIAHRLHILLRQFTNCLVVSSKLLVKAWTSLLIMLAFPLVAVVLTVQVAGKDMFETSNATSSGCFFLVCACIWGGLFNSVQLIVKQRDTLQADMAAGLYPSMFMLANAIVQLVLCSVQSAILLLCFPWIEAQYGHQPPPYGRIINNTMLEYYVTFLLLFYAADALGLVISTLVKKAETASVITPYILIVQLIFSGLLFPLSGVTDTISYGMESRWGMEALAVTSDINYYPDKVSRQQIKETRKVEEQTRRQQEQAQEQARQAQEQAEQQARQQAQLQSQQAPAPSPATNGTDAQSQQDSKQDAAQDTTVDSFSDKELKDLLGREPAQWERDDTDGNDEAAQCQAASGAAYDGSEDENGERTRDYRGVTGYDKDGRRIEYGSCFNPSSASASYEYTVKHLWQVWGILAGFVVVFLVLADILVHRYKSTKNLGRD
ncbi:ABC transporter permease [Bifidobacterium gallicum]|uniref:ABC-2 type transporter n=1 Tax=Bifidobacterium gallicum DSM 20093 = LMG 11596 TaxID=561180 RepID=D1NRW3_9BIFI|nr:ABC transporter permease [Bifidobacterium gallicum]EFA23415.1 ABC-2 type transporter [Bifidobacterium gallicum DSM 20093 = LMG 11596]KFI57288.1 putative FHA domain containing protein [Bifidobacterium gallicum DSM 20093 = LMG 11596]